MQCSTRPAAQNGEELVISAVGESTFSCATTAQDLKEGWAGKQQSRREDFGLLQGIARQNCLGRCHEGKRCPRELADF